MANTAGIANAAKQAALGAIVDGKSLKAALYYTASTVNNGTAAYTATGEVSGSGYTAGGVAVTNANTAQLSGNTTYWTPSAAISFGTVTIANFDAVLLYDTGATNRSIGVFTFGNQSVTAAPFSLTMPTNDGSTGLVRIG